MLLWRLISYQYKDSINYQYYRLRIKLQCEIIDFQIEQTLGKEEYLVELKPDTIGFKQMVGNGLSYIFEDAISIISIYYVGVSIIFVIHNFWYSFLTKLFVCGCV